MIPKHGIFVMLAAILISSSTVPLQDASAISSGIQTAIDRAFEGLKEPVPEKKTVSKTTIASQPGIHEVTLRISHIKQTDNPDGWPSGNGDYYAEVWIDGKFGRSKDVITGKDFGTNWTFTKEITKALVPIKIKLWDSDGGFNGGNDEMDINPSKSKKDINLEYNVVTKEWSGDMVFPYNISQGHHGGEKAEITFWITSKNIDKDGDYVSDHNDKCPNEKGSKNTKGCPDGDGDGIADNRDACPKERGTTSRGCPDTDKDGITDKQDACPKERGPARTNGCPERDGDGIADNRDACPKERGPASNNGCPERISRNQIIDKLESQVSNLITISDANKMKLNGDIRLQRIVDDVTETDQLRVTFPLYIKNPFLSAVEFNIWHDLLIECRNNKLIANTINEIGHDTRLPSPLNNKLNSLDNVVLSNFCKEFKITQGGDILFIKSSESTSISGSIQAPNWNDHGIGNSDEGDPLIFSITDKPVDTIRNWPEQHKSLLTEFDLYDTGENVTLSRTLDKGTMTMFLDLNGDGELSNGTEWLYDQNENVYQIMSRPLIDSNQNGFLDYSDDIWNLVMIKDGSKYYSASELGIVAFNWSNAVKGHGDMHGDNRQYTDCLYEGIYLYPECVVVNDNHFAIAAYNENSIIVNDGRLLDSFGSVMGHLDMSEIKGELTG